MRSSEQSRSVQSNWQAQGEQTNQFWLTALLWAVRLLGRGIVRWLILPFVACFFLLGNASARRASRSFLTRVGDFQNSPQTLPQTQSVGLWQVAKHMHTFATVSLDRLRLMQHGTHGITVEVVNEHLFDELAEGAMLMTSHFGSFDVMRVLAADDRELNVHILLDIAHSQRALIVGNV